MLWEELNMKIPKVKFTEIPIETEIRMFYYFLFENDWDWSKSLFQVHPNLKEVKELKSKKDRIAFITKYIKGFRKVRGEVIDKNKEIYKKNWEKIEKDFLLTLSEVIEEEWPKNRKEIVANMSINTICPRDIKDWCFSIFYNYDKKLIATKLIAHEITHFLYFERWKKLYPKMDQKRFNKPYIEWHLSEILAPVILNDKRLKKIIGEKSYGYKEHEKVKIGNKTTPKFFEDLYRKYQKENRSFEEFLKESYRVIKENKELFNF
ncbi:hypothetical protein KKH36_03110 [Patescibacteria group bacterium]|nr:hypothetical protein [Patescibacteria group bacterium]